MYFLVRIACFALFWKTVRLLNWLTPQSLHRGNQEVDADFARRVLLVVRKNYAGARLHWGGSTAHFWLKALLSEFSPTFPRFVGNDVHSHL
jgi:hypothetical protein